MARTTEQDFIASLDREPAPADLPPTLQAIRHGLRGEWEQAHGIVQGLDGADAAWIHAWLHRIEGDLDNAGYWYRRAGRSLASGGTGEEGRLIAAELLSR